MYSLLAERKNLRLRRIPADTDAAPTVSGCSPATIVVDGGTTCTLTTSGTITAVYIGGLPAADVVAVSATSVSCVSPPHDPGSYTIWVRGPGGWGVLANGVTYGGSASERVTEAGSVRITEAGDRRITES